MAVLIPDPVRSSDDATGYLGKLLKRGIKHEPAPGPPITRGKNED